MEARVAVDPIFDAFGVAATVTRPNEAPVETTAVWVPDESGTSRFAVDGPEINRVVPRKILAFRFDEVPALPYNTLVEAPAEQGGEVKRWRVDELDRVESDLIRVIVAPLETADFLESWGKT